MSTIRSRSSSALRNLLALTGFAVFLGSCASTGGEGGEINPNNTQRCVPDRACLTLTASSPVPVGSVGTGRARLRDPNGAPIAAEEICFVFDAPVRPGIIEPSDQCGHTTSEGIVSIRYASDRPGSFILFAVASAQGLDDQETVVFTGDPICLSDAECPSSAFCGQGEECDGETFTAGACIQLRPDGECCVRGEHCISGSCDGSGVCGSGP